MISAEEAIGAADDYLIDNVGDLLGADAPVLESGVWGMRVYRSNVRQPEPVHVGRISVNGTTGEVLFARETREKPKAAARVS